MIPSQPSVVRQNVVRFAILALIGVLYLLSRPPVVSQAQRLALASRFHFTAMPLYDPAQLPHRSIRQVHPSLTHISAWISSVGAAVALADLDGDGLPNDACHVDPRTDTVVVAPVPGTLDRYQPLLLHPAPLPYDARTMAPMGCLPGDLDEDGHLDLIVYYWGRTPVAFLRRGERYFPQEIVATQATPERWYTNSAIQADLDGDGHLDLIFANYFPDGARILDAQAGGQESMQRSMSRAYNGGGKHLLLWAGEKPGALRFIEPAGVLEESVMHGWTLALGAADLDGDLLPEVYFANDFGPDRLLHNRSTPGKLRFARLEAEPGWTRPSSTVLGRDSFKGMGVDFGDLNGDGLLDIYVSNIANPFALMESHFCFINTGATAQMRAGVAPYVNRSEALGLSRSSWSWESRLSDFDNDGVMEAMQATGFIKGTANRWPDLQELATGNDGLLHHPWAWPRFQAGDDLSGDQHNPFFVLSPTGRYVDIAPELGLDAHQITRGIATADVDGDGDLDFALANQWEPSALYRNDCPSCGSFLGLHLLLPVSRGTSAATRVRAGHPGPDTPGRPAIGAAATVYRADGRRLVAQVDGGNGHSGKRSPDLHFGLGGVGGDSVRVELRWRDPAGQVRHESLQLPPGWHTVLFGASSEP